ncbi:alkaline phosphatase family protein [Moniliophthora roreri MCA 2997]|uniref:Alkaline phosphatase family protein n=1 Tax=Moniliophthora roreri (strain MCA 2997) TaxID=1381753 RepID=V2XJM1_MONRO|nr:alkaline phosphatase family protein [Moniliophthora roreri MCA 2997]
MRNVMVRRSSPDFPQATIIGKIAAFLLFKTDARQSEENYSLNLDPNPSLNAMSTSLLRFSGVIASAYLKYNTWLFLRKLPLGYRFIPRLIAAFGVFAASFLLQPRSRTKNTALPVVLGFRGRNNLVDAVTILLNTLFLMSCADFIYRGQVLYPVHKLSTSRVGWTNSTTTRIVVSYPGPSSFNFSYTNDITNWTVIISNLEIQNEATTITLAFLEPSTRYTYSTSLGHSGSFLTSAPESMPTTVRFISTSCMKPFFPYSPFKHPFALQGLQHLSSYLSRNTSYSQDFILFLGDFIYTDLPIVSAPLTREYYTNLYRQIYASPDYTPILRNTPWLHMFDDHEIINDFWPGMDVSSKTFAEAIQPFLLYQNNANPPPLYEDVFYYTFRRGDASFFVLDTRSYRDQPADLESGGHGKRSMLGLRQLEALKAWIRSEKGWKVVVSGVPMTQNWSKGSDAMDSWGGYLDEREEIFRELWAVGGGIIVSGDRHEHATVKFPPPAGEYPENNAIIEFSTSPLSFFYQPFARDYEDVHETDVTVYQHWKGTSKFGAFELEKEVARFQLVVDGEVVWEYNHRRTNYHT